MIAKKIKYALAGLIVVCSCVENKSWDDDSSISAADGEKTFNLLAAPYTRAVANQSDLSVDWSAGDRISLLDGEQNREFVTAEGGSLAQFSGYASAAECYYAMYPYNESVTLTGDVLSFAFPSQQQEALGSVPNPSSSIWTGKSRGSIVVMNNLCSTLIFSFAENDVKNVTITGSASEKLCGNVYVTFEDDRAIVTTSQLTGESIVLLPSAGDVFAAGTHSVCLLPGEYNNGLILTFTRADGEQPIVKKINTVTSLAAASMVDLGTLDLNAPELQSVSVSDAVASGSGATLNGAMEVIRFNPERVSCGFEYRLSEEDSWNSVTCETSAEEFSYRLKGLNYSSDPVIYRSWSMVDGYKMYSEEKTFTMLPTYSVTFPFVVPEEEYKKNAEILTTWGFGTNGKMFKNKTDEEKNALNASEWVWQKDDKEFSFRFWCRIDHQGFCTRAITQDKDLPTEYYTYHGVCLNYTSGADCYSWALLPSIHGARLVAVEAQLYDKKTKLSLCSSVDAEGKPVESSIIETLTTPNSNYGTISFNCPDTVFGTRYYLSATTGRTTICNLTLTYQYE